MKFIIIDISDESNHEIKKWPECNILIFSDEWDKRKIQWRSLINAKENRSIKNLHARNCKIREISLETRRNFLEDNHIQGSNNLSIVCFGLFNNEELVSIMSLGRHNRNISKNKIVLDRFCNKINTRIRGGASKLFKHCIEWAKRHKYEEIISFSDNRWSEGEIYKILGFQLEKCHRPDYCYVDTNCPTKRVSKQSQKKSSSKCPIGMTELQWANKRGLSRLWDKGKKRWVYLLEESKLTLKEKLSKKCAEQHKNGCFKHSHMRGYFKSKKCNSEIYYGSSYELRCIYLLENNKEVIKYKRAGTFVDSNNRTRNPDLQVEYHNNVIEIIEIKPNKRLKEPEVIKQIEATSAYCNINGYKFTIWTENDSRLSDDKEIINWAKKYILESTGDMQWIEKQKESSRRKAKKYYKEKIATNKIKFYCDFCNGMHEVLRRTYDKNIIRNGTYICGKRGGYISGVKPKLSLIKENKKQCNTCKKVLLFENFSPSKSICKQCRAEAYREKYLANKNNHYKEE